VSFKIFMVIYAILSGVFGLGFVLVPGILFPIYGVEPNASLRFIGQLFGAVLISLAFLSWLVRNLGDSVNRRAILYALFAGETLGFIIALIGQINGVLNIFGWLIVAVYLFLAVGLAYFLFVKPAS